MLALMGYVVTRMKFTGIYFCKHSLELALRRFRNNNRSVCVAADKSPEYFLCVRRILLANCPAQTVNFLGPEITMIFISVDSYGKALAITLGMKLGGINILADAKHLDRAGFSSH